MAEHPEGRTPRPQRHPLVALLGPVVAGIYLDRVGQVPLAAWSSMACLTWLVWCWCQCRLRANFIWHVRLTTGLLLAGFLCASAAWHQLRWDRFPVDEIGRRAPEVAIAVCLRVQSLEVPQRIRADEDDRLARFPPTASHCVTCVP